MIIKRQAMRPERLLFIRIKGMGRGILFNDYFFKLFVINVIGRRHSELLMEITGKVCLQAIAYHTGHFIHFIIAFRE